MAEAKLDTHQKALRINLDPRRYGTFAEIGAGQEVVRWFFRAGGAAGTIAKSISAYDMTVSDAIYGPCERYVCRSRLENMLCYEHELNLDRLGQKRGETTAFFAFADTVAARSFRGTNECHGWIGVRFQASPREADSQIILHVRMLDTENALQQEALGVVGVNLLYAAFFLHNEPELLLASLLDSLSPNRLEIDMVEFSGAAFAHVDNRVMSLRLVQLGFTGAAMFSATGEVLQPSEVLYKKAILVERGSFQPVTHATIDLLRAAEERFRQEPDVAGERVVQLMEIAMYNLRTGDEVDLADFLARVDVLAACGKTVLISDYSEFYRLAAYLRRYSKKKIGIALGAASLQDLFDPQYYDHLEGGILESFGRLFKNDLKLYVYPLRDPDNGQLTMVDNLEVASELRTLYRYLVDRGCIEQLLNYTPEYLPIFAPHVLEQIRSGAAEWEQLVPSEVAAVIKERGLFGYRAPSVLPNWQFPALGASDSPQPTTGV